MSMRAEPTRRPSRRRYGSHGGEVGVDHEEASRGHRLHAQEGLDEGQNGAGRPALGLVGGGAHTGVDVFGVAGDAAKDLGQQVAAGPSGLEDRGGVPLQVPSDSGRSVGTVNAADRTSSTSGAARPATQATWAVTLCRPVAPSGPLLRSLSTWALPAPS